MSKKFRKQFRFWLDYSDKDQVDLAVEIEQIKKQGRANKERSFARACRDGLRLIFDLWRGKVDVLLELFPDIRQRLAEHDDTTAMTNSNNLMLPHQDKLAEAIDTLSHVLASQRDNPTQYIPATNHMPSALPDGLFDDVEIETVESEIDVEAGLKMLLSSFD